MQPTCMLALVIVAVAGCGGTDKATSTGQPPTVASTTTEQPPAPAPGLGDAQPLTPGHTYATQLFRPAVSRPLLQGLQVTPAG